MPSHKIHYNNIAEIRMPDGILLIGSANEPEIVYWRKFTRQDRLSTRAGYHLRYHEDAAAQLRRLADRVGLISLQARMSDVIVGETIHRAINNHQLSAVFLPSTNPHLIDRTPLKIYLTFASSKSVLQANFHFGHATRIERVIEMLRRTPPFLQGEIKQVFDELLSSSKLMILGGTLAAIAAGNLLGYGEIIEISLAAIAYAIAGWSGLIALKDIVGATTQAITASQDSEISESAKQFASGLTVLGQAFLTFVIARAARRSGGRAAADEESTLATRKSTLKQEPIKPASKRPEETSNNNRAKFEKYKNNLRANMEKPPTKNEDLSKLISENYRKNSTVGSGSTAAAVRQELATGKPVGNKFHSIKAEGMIKALSKWLKENPTASPGDRAAAENVILDLKNALKGK